MKDDFMNSDPHERSRLMIALYDPKGLSEAELAQGELFEGKQSWLAAHLQSCSSCREFAENSRETIRSLRGIPIAASRSLVIETQMRVRRRAVELQRQRERLRVIVACCAAVTLCTAASSAILWRGLAWITQQVPLSAPVREGGFIVFYLMPAVLAGILLLARGTFLADHNR